MKNLLLVAAAVGLAGTAAFLITNNLRNDRHEPALPKGKRRHLTSAFKKHDELHREVV